MLLDAVDERPRRRVALELGLHGLRTGEIVDVTPDDVRQLSNGSTQHVVVVKSGKTGKRETPIANLLAEGIRNIKRHDVALTARREIFDISKRTIRNWIGDAHEALLDVDEDASQLGRHDLRRAWATDMYFSLAVAGVPIAEQLVMSWGGWKQTAKGRDTFRTNYLGPVPDHVTAEALGRLDSARGIEA